MIYIGVDPGAKGGYGVIWYDKEELVCVEAYPWSDWDFVRCLQNLRYEALKKNDHIVAAVEKVGAMPKNGAVSMFNFGKSAGFIEGVLSALDISYQLVPPRVWKKEFSLNSDKQKSIEVCKKLFGFRSFSDVCHNPTS